MTTSITIHTTIVTAAAADLPTPGDSPTAGALGALAGVSPALAGAYLAYLAYLAIRMLIPAVLIFCTIRVVPASQRSVLLQTYLGAAPDPSAAAAE